MSPALCCAASRYPARASGCRATFEVRRGPLPCSPREEVGPTSDTDRSSVGRAKPQSVTAEKEFHFGKATISDMVATFVHEEIRPALVRQQTTLDFREAFDSKHKKGSKG
eukprot:6198436-Pleurochrysis_carterae.AAC.1